MVSSIKVLLCHAILSILSEILIRNLSTSFLSYKKLKSVILKLSSLFAGFYCFRESWERKRRSRDGGMLTCMQTLIPAKDSVLYMHLITPFSSYIFDRDHFFQLV